MAWGFPPVWTCSSARGTWKRNDKIKKEGVSTWDKKNNNKNLKELVTFTTDFHTGLN